MQKQHDECSRTINRLMLILVGCCFVSSLMGGASDALLAGYPVEDDTTRLFDLPYIGFKINYLRAISFAPIILVGLTIYMHLFVGQWLKYDILPESQRIPVIFNMHGVLAKFISGFFFYWMVPVVLLFLAFKGEPRDGLRSYLFLFATVATAILVFLQIRRCPDNKRKWRNVILWVILFVVATFSVRTLVTDKFPFTRSLGLYKASLRGMDLSHLNLKNAYMEKADLSETIIGGQNLGSAVLVDANLTGAHLAASNLKKVKFSKQVNLSKAHLENSNLGGANLTQNPKSRPGAA